MAFAVSINERELYLSIGADTLTVWSAGARWNRERRIRGVLMADLTPWKHALNDDREGRSSARSR